MEPSRHSMMTRRRISHNFGNFQPQTGCHLGFGAPRSRTDIFIPEEFFSTSRSEEEIRNMILSRQFCFANSGPDGSGYWNNMPVDTVNECTLYVVPTEENNGTYGEVQNCSNNIIEPQEYEMEKMNESDEEMPETARGMCGTEGEMPETNEDMSNGIDGMSEIIEQFYSRTSTNVKPASSPVSHNAPKHSSSSSKPVKSLVNVPEIYPGPPSSPTFTIEMLIKNRIELDSKGQDDIIVNDGSHKIKKCELSCFEPGQWLQDKVV